MIDTFLDLSAGDGLLQATIAGQITFWADIALRPGKLNEDDTNSLRRLKAHLDHSAQLLGGVLSRVAPADAAEIERLVAQILRDAGMIWHLLPMPTPNARDLVTERVQRAKNKKSGLRLRTAKAEKPDARARDQAYRNVFTERQRLGKLVGLDKNGIWTEAGRCLPKINAELKSHGIEVTQHTVRRQLRKFLGLYRK